MKNAAVLFGMWLGIILFAYSVAYLSGDRAPGIELPGDAVVVRAPHGFSLALPPSWSLRAGDPADVLVSPIAGVEVWALDVPALTPDAALVAAWDVIDPCSACDRSPILAATALDDERDGVAVVLGADGEGRTGRAVVLLVADSARVLLVRLAAGAVLPARVLSDLAKIEASLRGMPAEAAAPRAEPEPAPVPSLV